MKFLTKAAIITTAGIGYYLYKTKQTPSEAAQNMVIEAKHKKAALEELKVAKQNFDEALANFKGEMGLAQDTTEDLQRIIDEFTFIVQPHIDEVNKYVNKLKQ